MLSVVLFALVLCGAIPVPLATFIYCIAHGVVSVPVAIFFYCLFGTEIVLTQQ